MTWQLYTAVSVLALAFSVLIQRVLIYRHQLNPTVFASLLQFMVALVLLPYALLHGLDFHGFRAVLPIIVLSALGFGVGSILYNKALQVIDASAFSVFFATHAVWIIVVGIWFLHESLALLQIVGSVFVFLSVFLLVKDARSFQLDRRFALGMGTGLAYGIAISCSAYISRQVDIPTWAVINFLTGGTVTLALSPNNAKQYSAVLRSSALSKIAGLSVLYALGNITLSYAYKYGPLSLVSPLRQTGIIVTTLLAFALLKDERTDVARKLMAATICTAGVILLLTQNN